MKNFEFILNNKSYWYSRAIVCSAYIYVKFRNDWYVLVAERPEGRMNVPGGFLDHGETTMECAIRETFEETGVEVNNLTFYETDSNPVGELEHVKFTYYTNLGEVDELLTTTLVHSEPGEALHVFWMKIDFVDEFEWIYKQRELIHEIFQEKIVKTNN